MPETLSPSRASLWKRCPQQYKFRHIDLIPEPKTAAPAMGNLVHKVLEDLMILEPEERTEAKAQEILSEWVENGEGQPWDELDGSEVVKARGFVSKYFEMEDPSMVEADELEIWVSTEIEGTRFRGIVDRLDLREEGAVVVDYKTGRTPDEKWEANAFFGLRFYALCLWRENGWIPKAVCLYYLASGKILTLEPTEKMLTVFERQIVAIAKAIDKATETNTWPAKPGGICKSCSFKSRCPAWKGLEEGF